MSSSGDIEYTFYDDNDNEVTADILYFYTAGRAANTTWGHPDNYSPSEPSEIDIHQVSIDGTVLGREAEKKFLAEHADRIYEQIDEQETGGQ